MSICLRVTRESIIDHQKSFPFGDLEDMNCAERIAEVNKDIDQSLINRTTPS